MTKLKCITCKKPIVIVQSVFANKLGIKPKPMNCDLCEAKLIKKGIK